MAWAWGIWGWGEASQSKKREIVCENDTVLDSKRVCMNAMKESGLLLLRFVEGFPLGVFHDFDRLRKLSVNFIQTILRYQALDIQQSAKDDVCICNMQVDQLTWELHTIVIKHSQLYDTAWDSCVVNYCMKKENGNDSTCWRQFRYRVDGTDMK